MYVGDRPPDDKIRALANEPTPPLDDRYKCAAVSAEKIMDRPWVNGFGQTCQWLFHNMFQYPGGVAYAKQNVVMCNILVLVLTD